MIFALQMTLINIMLQEENNNEKCDDVTLTTCFLNYQKTSI